MFKQKSMNQITVSAGRCGDGMIRIFLKQESICGEEGEVGFVIEQVPIVVKWIMEAAGVAPDGKSPG